MSIDPHSAPLSGRRPAPPPAAQLLDAARDWAAERLVRHGTVHFSCLYRGADGRLIALTPYLPARPAVKSIYTAVRDHLIADGASHYALVGEARVQFATGPAQASLIVAACSAAGPEQAVVHRIERHDWGTGLGLEQPLAAGDYLDERALTLLAAADPPAPGARQRARERLLQALPHHPLQFGRWQPTRAVRPC